MTTIKELADEFGMQEHEVTTFLDIPWDTVALDDENAAWAREVLSVGADIVDGTK